MLIPKSLSPNFRWVQPQNSNRENTTAGELICCGKQRFALEYEGEIKYSLWGTGHLSSPNGQVTLTARCKECGRNILVFDSAAMGYDRERETAKPSAGSPMACRRCRGNDFSVSIRLEYPDDSELQELDILEPDNAFSWIWVTLKCNTCGKKYQSFIDYETG